MGLLLEYPEADVFIETGLGHGNTLESALQRPYKWLHSIEIDPTLVARCGLYDPRLTIHCGSSPDILPTIIDPQKSTVFWLDAHYSAGQYTSSAAVDASRLDPRYGQCPLLAELAIIRSFDWAVRPWIAIDDAACFRMETYSGMYAQYDRGQYPTEAEIRAALPPDYTLEVVDYRGWAYRAIPQERRAELCR